MPGRGFVMDWAEEDTEAALKAAYRSEPDGKRRMRLQGLWLLRQGRSVEEVAAAVGVHRRTVERWVDWYRHQGGRTGVVTHRQGGPGRPARLTAEQQEHLATEVATGRFATAAQVGAWIAATYGVTYRPGGGRTCWGGCAATRRCPARSMSRRTSPRRRPGKGGPR